MSGLVMPSNEQAERNVIALCLHLGSAADAVGVLVPEDFYHPALRAVFASMTCLERQGKPIDPVTVGEAMTADGNADLLRQYGGAVNALGSMMAELVALDNLDAHAAIIRSKADRRRWIMAAREIAAAGYGDGDDAEFILAAEKKALELTSKRAGTGLKPLREVMRRLTREIAAHYDAKRAGGSTLRGITSGFTEIDTILGGLHDTDMVILGARPRMGKTAIALNIVRAAAATGVQCAVFSMEMSDISLAERWVASEARVKGDCIRTVSLEPNQWIRLTNATANLAEIPVCVDDRRLSMAETWSEARRWRMKHRPGTRALVVLDYVQLVKADKQRGRSREQEVAEISMAIKGLAKELNCPVLALAQLNRGLESREDKRPMLSDLRDSGQLEQDADVIAFLYRDEVYNADTADKNVAEFIVAKHRRGPCGVVKLAWIPEYTKFESLSNRSEP